MDCLCHQLQDMVAGQGTSWVSMDALLADPLVASWEVGSQMSHFGPAWTPKDPTNGHQRLSTILLKSVGAHCGPAAGWPQAFHYQELGLAGAWVGCLAG